CHLIPSIRSIDQTLLLNFLRIKRAHDPTTALQRIFLKRDLMMFHKHYLGVVVLLLASSAAMAQENTLTEKEKQEARRLLFDGRTTQGWMTTQQAPLSPKHVQEGSLNPHPCNYMLVHETPWENFELALDFKISPKCNSGVFLRTWPLTPRPGKDVGFN